MKKVTSVTLTLALAGATFAGTVLPANAETTTVSPDISTQATINYDVQKQDILNRINAYRAENGLKPVTLKAELSTVAQNWTTKTATAGTFYHNPDFSKQIPANWNYAAEIIAASSSPEAIVWGWKNSPDHDAELLEARSTVIGIGYEKQTNPDGEYYGAYYSTVVFADYTPVAAQPIAVTPVQPQFDDSTYSIPNVTGLSYFVDGVETAAGTYGASSVLTFTVKAKPGYVLKTTSIPSWTHDFSPKAAVIEITAQSPFFNSSSYTIPSIQGIQYKVNGVVAQAGNYTNNGVVNVIAEALPGYILVGPSSWSKDYTPVIKNVTATAPTFDDKSYTIPSVEGVQYKINGVNTQAGTYTSTTKVTVSAVAVAGYTLVGTSSWSKDYTPIVLSAIGIRAKELNGSLGKATSGEVYGLKNGGGYQNFERGSIIWSPTTGARISSGGIRTEYSKAGLENGRLGYPTTDEYVVKGGVVQNYQGGKIAWSSAGGARIVDGSTLVKWNQSGAANGPLGLPTSNKMGGLVGGGMYQNFQKGAILWSAETGAKMSYGAIRTEYGRNGFERASLGYPKSDPYVARNGLVQDFQGGKIAWSSTSGARVVNGATLAKWNWAGAGNGALGLPTSQKVSGLIRGGMYQNFQGGAIMWSPATGAITSTNGLIRNKWLSLGAERSRLGYPTSDKLNISGGMKQNFQGGTITWQSGSNRITVTYK